MHVCMHVCTGWPTIYGFLEFLELFMKSIMNFKSALVLVLEFNVVFDWASAFFMNQIKSCSCC